MGSLAFAAGGALGGLGQGLADIGKQSLVAQREEALTRLREEFANESQAKGFAHEEASQQKVFGDQEKMHGIEHTEAVSAAEAGRGFAEKQQGEKLKSEESRTERTAESRENVARIRADQADKTAANKPKPKEWTPTAHLFNTVIPDPSDPTGKTMIPGQKSTTVITHRSGFQLVQLADGRFVPFSGDVSKLPDPAGFPRPPAAKVQLLLEHPEKAQDFLNKYHQLPQQWWQIQTFHDNNPQSGGGAPESPAPQRNAQSGPTFMDQYQKDHPASGGVLGAAKRSNMASPMNQPSSGGGGNAAPGTSGEVETDNADEDARADAEDAQAQTQMDADDNAPAKE